MKTASEHLKYHQSLCGRTGVYSRKDADTPVQTSQGGLMPATGSSAGSSAPEGAAVENGTIGAPTASSQTLGEDYGSLN